MQDKATAFPRRPVNGFQSPFAGGIGGHPSGQVDPLIKPRNFFVSNTAPSLTCTVWTVYARLLARTEKLSPVEEDFPFGRVPSRHRSNRTEHRYSPQLVGRPKLLSCFSDLDR